MGFHVLLYGSLAGFVVDIMGLPAPPGLSSQAFAKLHDSRRSWLLCGCLLEHLQLQMKLRRSASVFTELAFTNSVNDIYSSRT